TYSALPQEFDGGRVPNYLQQLFQQPPSQKDAGIIPERIMTSFQRIWAQQLGWASPGDRTVLEPACGSANDYRFLDAYGLARLVKYSGFDLCEKNVRNAQQMFPEARFQVGNIFEIDAADRSYDFGIVHDLFEHLSVAGMEAGLEELCR